MAAGDGLLQLDPGEHVYPPEGRAEARKEERKKERPRTSTFSLKRQPPLFNLENETPQKLPPPPPPNLTSPASELRFRFELRKNVTATLSLHNPGSDRVAFKLKTTAPKKFAVRPSSGIVEPGTTKEVHVSLSFFFF